MPDFILHFMAGAILGLIRIPFIPVLAIAALKECFDWMGYGTAEFDDFMWSAFGALLACTNSPFYYIRNKTKLLKLYKKETTHAINNNSEKIRDNGSRESTS